MDAERLKALLSEGWGHEATHISPVSGGMDADARAFRADLADGEALFLKLRRTLDPGIVVSRFLYDLGIGSVVAPLPTQEGVAALRADDGWLLAYPFVEGQNGFQRRLEPAHWRAFGATLRAVHDAPLAVAEAVAVEDFRPVGLEPLRQLAQGETSAPSGLAELVWRHRAELLRLFARTAELAEACRAQAHPYVLCHADAHVGNVLVAGDRLHLIDWDGPRRSPRERDLMFVVDGGIMSGHGPTEETAFFEGYGPVELDSALLSFYRHAWAVDDFAAFAREAQSPAMDDPSRGGEALRHFARLFEPGEILDLAFRLDRG